jgi:predicted nucleic acid-binding protein
MNELVIDTSVVCKWFLEEGETSVEMAGELLHQHLVGTTLLIAPASLPLELANVLRYSDMNDSTMQQTLEDFHFAHLELFELTQNRLEAASLLARRHKISVYDAVFLALAQERECPLVSADRKAFSGIETDVEIRLL